MVMYIACRVNADERKRPDRHALTLTFFVHLDIVYEQGTWVTLLPYARSNFA